MRYALLLRGINVGGRNKIKMASLVKEVENLGYSQVATYINSGNLFFETSQEVSLIIKTFKEFFCQTYPFVTDFALISAEEFKKEALPAWWNEDLARKDVLFYTTDLDILRVKEAVTAMTLGDEVIHFGRLGLYWGKYQEATFSKTAYHKQLGRTDFYKKVTIRNSKTYAKLATCLGVADDY